MNKKEKCLRCGAETHPTMRAMPACCSILEFYGCWERSKKGLCFECWKKTPYAKRKAKQIWE